MDPYSLKGKRILIAPLNWGLGHATRSASLINYLKKDNEVTIASDGGALAWLRKEFPTVNKVEFPLFNMTYSKHFGAMGGILRKIPHFLRSIQRDKNALDQLLKTQSFDLIISDNRYGVYHDNLPCYLISHQLSIPHPISSFIEMPLYNLIEKFDELWIPDTKDHALSGDLSKANDGLKIPIHYIGALSRFQIEEEQDKDIKFLLIASGPEPHKMELIDYFGLNFQLLNEECHIVGNDSEEKIINEKLHQHGSLNTIDLEQLIHRSEIIICRSGYSSIMDLTKLNKKAVLIPTPGQLEQKYLAERHKDNPLFNCALSNSDLSKIMKSLI